MNTELFSAFKTFVDALNTYRWSETKSLHLYSHLLSKITSEHTGAINKNCEIIRKFITINKIAIEEQDENKFSEIFIKYSDKVFINIQEIFNQCNDDNETKELVWKHLLTLSIKSSNNNDKALEKLKQLNSLNLNFDLDKITSMLNEDSPVAPILQHFGGDKLLPALRSIITSNNFKNLIEDVKDKINNGDIDISKIQNNMGSASDIFTKFAPMAMNAMNSSQMPDLSDIGNMQFNDPNLTNAINQAKENMGNI